MQAVLDVLERPYYQLQETPAGLEAQVPSPVWQGLQAATALRRLLHPSRLLPQQAEVCATMYLTCDCSRLLLTQILQHICAGHEDVGEQMHASVDTSENILVLQRCSHAVEDALIQCLFCETRHVKGDAFIFWQVLFHPFMSVSVCQRLCICNTHALHTAGV